MPRCMWRCTFLSYGDERICTIVACCFIVAFLFSWWCWWQCDQLWEKLRRRNSLRFAVGCGQRSNAPSFHTNNYPMLVLCEKDLLMVWFLGTTTAGCREGCAHAWAWNGKENAGSEGIFAGREGTGGTEGLFAARGRNSRRITTRPFQCWDFHAARIF